MPSLPDVLAEHLRTRRRIAIRGNDAIVCSVLIPLMPVAREAAAATGALVAATGRTATIAEAAAPWIALDDDEFDVVYTLRSEHLPSHKGQVAFPGGKRDGEEESLATALRESAEEVGIVPADVRIVGALDDVSTMAGKFVITPWVGVLPAGYPFRADPSEVADIFHVRLSALGDPRFHASTTKHWGGSSYDVPIITAGRHEIWGATHEITRGFLDAVADARRFGRR